MKRDCIDRVDVSVVIPTFHRERQVRQAVDSALAQSGVAIEVVVLDDSTEGSARAVIDNISDERVSYRLQPEPSGGRPAIVRNDGARLTCGRFLHFLDDDDELMPGSLRALVSTLEDNPGSGVAVGRVVPFGNDPVALEADRVWAGRAARLAARTSGSPWLAAASLLFKSSMLVNSACLVRRDVFDACGGYDPAVPTYEDLEFYARAITRFGHVFVDHPVLHRRTGEPSLSRDLPSRAPIEECYGTMYRKYREHFGWWHAIGARLLAKVALP